MCRLSDRAAYLQVHRRPPYRDWISALDAASPPSDARHAPATAVADALGRARYVPISLDHFALPDDSLARAAQSGTLRRNFQGHTPFGFLEILSETGAWTRANEAGQLRVGKGVALSCDDKMRAHVIEHLMCVGAVDLVQAGRKYAVPDGWYNDHSAKLLILRSDALIFHRGARVTVAANDAPLDCASVMDAYQQRSAARPAFAV